MSRPTAEQLREAGRKAMRALRDAEARGEFSDPWKCGDEFLPFHPQASHVPADYRDGWNACYMAAQRLLQQGSVTEGKP